MTTGSPTTPMTGTAVLHDAPLNVSALPSESTAMQNVAEGHETEPRPPTKPEADSMFCGALHVEPL